MGHCTHYSGMATARCRRTRRNGVGRWSGRVTIMQVGMAERQKGTDDAMMQRLQPSQVMTRELQLTKPSGAKNGACGCAHSRWPAQPQGDEAGGRMELRPPNLSVRNLQVCKVPSLCSPHPSSSLTKQRPPSFHSLGLSTPLPSFSRVYSTHRP